MTRVVSISTRFAIPVTLSLLAATCATVGRAQEAAESPAADVPGEPSDLVSNVFFDTDIRQALSDVAAQTGAIIIADEIVSGFVSLELTDVPLHEALKLILMAGGYIYEEVEKGVYLVTSTEPDAPGFRYLAETQIVELDYIECDELQGLLPEMYGQYVKMNNEGDRVVVTAPAELLEKTVYHIRALDQPPLQVMIEAMVIETEAAALDEFEISLRDDHLSIDTAHGLITYFGKREVLLHRLLWLMENRRAEIRANPRVVAQEGTPATVAVSVEQYFVVLTGRVGYEYARLEQIDATVGLTITARVAEADRKITCHIEPVVGDVTGMTAEDLPIITERTATTTVRVADGQVIAIAGLLQEATRKIVRKIPVLGDLPLIGPLFRSTKKAKEKRETVILIAPHILDEEGNFEGPTLQERMMQVAEKERASAAAEAP